MQLWVEIIRQTQLPHILLGRRTKTKGRPTARLGLLDSIQGTKVNSLGIDYLIRQCSVSSAPPRANKMCVRSKWPSPLLSDRVCLPVTGSSVINFACVHFPQVKCPHRQVKALDSIGFIFIRLTNTTPIQTPTQHQLGPGRLGNGFPWRS